MVSVQRREGHVSAGCDGKRVMDESKHLTGEYDINTWPIMSDRDQQKTKKEKMKKRKGKELTPQKMAQNKKE